MERVCRLQVSRRISHRRLRAHGDLCARGYTCCACVRVCVHAWLRAQVWLLHVERVLEPDSRVKQHAARQSKNEFAREG